MVPEDAKKRASTFPIAFWTGKCLLQEKRVHKGGKLLQESLGVKSKNRKGLSKYGIYLLLSPL